MRFKNNNIQIEDINDLMSIFTNDHKKKHN